MVTAALLSLAIAQVAIEKQPDLDAMQAVVKEAWAKRPRDAKALVAIKQGPIEPTLAADLVGFDWLTPGSWSFPEQKFDARWEDEEPYQYDLARVLPDGQRLSFTFSLNRKDATKREVKHTNFTLPSPIAAGLKKVGKETYLEITAYGAKEFHRVVSYEKGLLIVDVSYDGVPRSKKVKFRDVWVAMPKKFESTGR